MTSAQEALVIVTARVLRDILEDDTTAGQNRICMLHAALAPFEFPGRLMDSPHPEPASPPEPTAREERNLLLAIARIEYRRLVYQEDEGDPIDPLMHSPRRRDLDDLHAALAPFQSGLTSMDKVIASALHRKEFPA